jgi:protein tyrosine phosphatase (PTP) superfamily phosphohydrolase (DUF442 family)
LLLGAGAEAGRVLFGNNIHTVIPGRVYRSAQLSPSSLKSLIRSHGIRTVVNLRGCCAPFPWFLEESRVTQERNIAQEDIAFSAGRLPSVPEIRRLVEVLDRTQYPILLHCRRGADRTGMASAVVTLLQTEAGLEEGRRQLGLRYGHLAVGRPAYLDQFLDLYEEWLRTNGLKHTRDHFRRWLLHDYCPGECRCEVKPEHFPAKLRAGKPCALHVRVRNTGVKPWKFRPETNAGVHGRYVVWNENDQQVASARAGLFPAAVRPGQSIDLTLALPALGQPGRYRLWVDMVDEQHCWFFQVGSEPLEMELEVGE